MELRIYRTFTWRYTGDIHHMVLGGNNPLTLVPRDELQYRDDAGEWQPVPVVEAAKPEHPRDKENREHSERMAREIKDIFANAKPVTLEELDSRQKSMTIRELMGKSKGESI